MMLRERYINYQPGWYSQHPEFPKLQKTLYWRLKSVYGHGNHESIKRAIALGIHVRMVWTCGMISHVKLRDCGTPDLL